MIVSSHLEKIARLSDLRGRLDPIEDFELWFWSTMVAGTNAVNAALHNAGITAGESAFPSQPGVYHVPVAGRDGEYRPVLKAMGDVLHVGRPPIPVPVPADIAEMMRDMETIEHYRDPCTRGDMAIDAGIVASCDRAYANCLRLLDRRLSEKTS